VGETNANVSATSIQYTRAKVKLRTLFPDAKRIAVDARRLEVEGLPLLPLPVLAEVLKVLTKVWGEDTHVETDFSVERELLRVERGQTVRRAG